MRHMLRILRPMGGGDGFGEATATGWAEVRVVHAERVKMSGKRSREASELFPRIHTEWNIRDTHPIDQNWRVEQLGGHLYDVVAIVPNEDRGMNTLICERVNP